MTYTGIGRTGETGCEGTEWESETSVRCMVGHGARGTRRVAMTAGERAGSMSEAYSVDLGSISTLHRNNGARTRSASVTVHGRAWDLVLDLVLVLILVLVLVLALMMHLLLRMGRAWVW